MKAKKLLERFENSPKVWTIKEELDENGYRKNVIKIYDSIADAHRDNPKISCSHIEDYCNATFFTKQNHWFAYVGYRMAPSIDEMIYGRSYEPVKQPRNDEYYPGTREEYISYWTRDMWEEIAVKFMGTAYKNSKTYPENSMYYADSHIADIISKLNEWTELPNFMRGLYSNGWRKGMLKQMVIDWCSKNLTRNKLLIRGYEPILTEKPEKRYWCRQSYKQANYL